MKFIRKQYVTNFDGQYPAKSPSKMFSSLYIPNDLGFVVAAINAYDNGETLTHEEYVLRHTENSEGKLSE